MIQEANHCSILVQNFNPAKLVGDDILPNCGGKMMITTDLVVGYNSIQSQPDVAHNITI